MSRTVIPSSPIPAQPKRKLEEKGDQIAGLGQLHNLKNSGEWDYFLKESLSPELRKWDESTKDTKLTAEERTIAVHVHKALKDQFDFLENRCAEIADSLRNA